MGNLTLYDISKEFDDVVNADELTDEEKEKYISILTDLVVQKSTSIIGVIRNLNAKIEAIEAEEKRLGDLKNSTKNNLTRLKDYTKFCMEKIGTSKVETEIGNISIAASPISVEVLDEEKVPNAFKTTKVETKIDKKAIANHFKDTGEIVDGVVIHTDNTNLRIR